MLPNTAPRVLRFGDCRLDARAERLWSGGELVHLTPKAFAVLLHLIERAGELVTREELFRVHWSDTAVTDDSLSRCIWELRRALGDEPRAPRYLATVHRRGFRFIAPVEPEASAEEAAVPRAFVGREAELERLRALLREALAGRARIGLLCGEPGVGKTRLAEELADEARQGGALAVWGRAHEGRGGPPFWVFIQLLRRYARDVEPSALRAQAGASLADLAALVPELAERVGPLPPPPALDPEEARFRFFDAVALTLQNAAAERPLVLLLDDIHAADPDSLRLLTYLARELAESRVLIVATYRDVGRAANAALEETLGELARSRTGRERVELRGLDREGVRRLLASFTRDDVAEQLAATALEKTGGNPLYLHELVRLLGDADAGAVPAAWRVDTHETIRQILARRLASVSPACRDALTLASVAGADFSLRLLERASEHAREPLLDALREAEVERLVLRARDPARYRFAHGLLREVLYDELRPGPRVRLHRRIAHALEDDPRSAPAELAHHFARALPAGDAEKAIRYATLAGERALAVLAFEDAAAYFEAALEALECTEPLDPARLCASSLQCARAHGLAGQGERACELARRAIAAARRTGSPELFRRAVTALCELEPGVAASAELLALLDEALASAGDDAPAARASLLALRGFQAFLAADGDAHEQISREAVRLAHRSGDPEALYLALRSRCFALRDPSREGEWRETYEELIALGRERQNGARELEGRLHRLEHQVQLANAREVAAELAELERLAESLRTPNARAAVLRVRASLAIARGELEHALELSQRALAVGRGVDPEFASVVSLLHLGSILDMHERLTQISTEVAVGAVANPRISLFQVGLILLQAESGQRDAARAGLDALVESDLAELARDVSWAGTLGNLALSCAKLGHAAAAARVYRELLPYAGRVITVAYHYNAGCASRFLGLLATVLGRFDEAEAHFETALAVDGRAGARSWQAQARLDYARMLLARGARGDAAHARRQLKEAVETAAKLGLSRIAREAALL